MIAFITFRRYLALTLSLCQITRIQAPRLRTFRTSRSRISFRHFPWLPSLHLLGHLMSHCGSIARHRTPNVSPSRICHPCSRLRRFRNHCSTTQRLPALVTSRSRSFHPDACWLTFYGMSCQQFCSMWERVGAPIGSLYLSTGWKFTSCQKDCCLFTGQVMRQNSCFNWVYGVVQSKLSPNPLRHPSHQAPHH